MLDINLIINQTEYVQNALKKKGFEADLSSVIENNNKRKQLLAKSDELKTEKNKLSASVPVVKNKVET